jgi:hypothetical protein
MNIGTSIKLLKDTKCILPDIILDKYEVVTVIQITKEDILVQDILDEYYIIPSDSLYKIVKVDKNFKITPEQVKKIRKQLKKTTIESVRNTTKVDMNSFLLRAVQRMQTVASNAATTTDVIESNKLILSGICASMVGAAGMQPNQANKLLMLSSKLLSNSNS